VSPLAASTNEEGLVELRLDGRNTTFQFTDATTGSPIPGLAVAIGTDPDQPGLALVVVADGYEQYPLQICLLEGAPATAAFSPPTSGAASAQADISLTATPGLGTSLISAFRSTRTGLLGAVQPQGSEPPDLSHPLLAALTALAT